MDAAGQYGHRIKTIQTFTFNIKITLLQTIQTNNTNNTNIHIQHQDHIITNNKVISCSQTSAMQQKCRMAEMDELLKSEMTKIKGFLMDVRFAMFFKFMLCKI